jgi:hypothetical protein
MRLTVPIMVLPLLLAACGSEETAKDAQQVDQVLANDDLIADDLTAIDAVSGADANMAADVDPSQWNADGNETSGDSKSSAKGKSTTRKPASSGDAPKPAEPTAPAAAPASSSETGNEAG